MEMKKVSTLAADEQDAIQRWRAKGSKQAWDLVFLVVCILTALLMLFLALSEASAGQYSGMGRHRGTGREGRESPQMPDQKLGKFSKQVNLTDDQKSKIKPILEEEAVQMQSIRQDSSLSREDRRAKFMQVRETTDNQIRSLLTKDR